MVSCGKARGRAKILSVTRVWRVVAAAVTIAGCGAGGGGPYRVQPHLLPQHVRTIRVRPFADPTGHFSFVNNFYFALKREFQNDRRLELVDTVEADGELMGEIKRYIHEPTKYDENNVVTEYKLWVLVDIGFRDLHDPRAANPSWYLWVEPRMSAQVLYSIQPGRQTISTEPEAQDQIIQKFTPDIVKRTIDGWTASSGISQRKLDTQLPPLTTGVSP